MRRYLPLMFAGLACLAMIDSAHAQAPIAGQPYQIPDGYTGYGSGTLINYGGFNYVIQGDGTMLLAADSAVTTQASEQPTAGQPYQVPTDFASSDAGTLISYGGADYVAQGDGTMLLQQPAGLDPGAYSGQGGTVLYDIQPGFSYGSNYSGPGWTGYGPGAGIGS